MNEVTNKSGPYKQAKFRTNFHLSIYHYRRTSDIYCEDRLNGDSSIPQLLQVINNSKFIIGGLLNDESKTKMEEQILQCMMNK